LLDFRDHKAPILAGLVASATGTAASLGLVIAGLTAAGASKTQVAFAVAATFAAYGLLSIALSAKYRMPISIVWSTPGAAMLISAGVLHLGFAASVGAFLVTGLLLAITGLSPKLGQVVSAIPKPIANAMLAGVILNFCVSPFQAVVQYPMVLVPVLVAWLVLTRVAPIWAAPVSIVLSYTLIAVLMPVNLAQVTWWPTASIVAPKFEWQAIISAAIPLYLVTMASQNIPGVAIMKSFGFEVPFRPTMLATGLTTLFGSVIGIFALNLAAITAALNANEQAHRNPARRWLASVWGGVVYILIAVVAAPVVAYVLETPHVLILAASGLALIGTMGGALREVTASDDVRVPAVVAFLVGASGIAPWGVGAAFWALAAGVLVWRVQALGRPKGA
jgi:benzoate membrane transport protein